MRKGSFLLTLSLVFSIAALCNSVYVLLIFGATDSAVEKALRDREKEIVDYLRPEWHEMYKVFGYQGYAENPNTIEELIEPWFSNPLSFDPNENGQ